MLKAQVEDAHSRTEAAIREFRLAVQAAPDDPSTYFRLGEELWQAGHFQDAVSTLLEGLKLDPHNAPADYQIGDSYLGLGQPERALPFLTAALKEDPDLDVAYKDFGTIYMNEGKYQQAVAVLERPAAHDTDGSVHYLLFRAYSRLGNKAKAAACLKRFQELKAAAQNQVLFDAQAAQRGPKGVAKDN